MTNTAVSGAFEWQPAPGSTDFTDPTNWTVGTTAPGGGNFALFNTGDHTAMGNGAVGQLINFGATTLTGNIVAQGIGGLAAVVDNGGALTLTGGALLSAQQQAIVGRSGTGLLLISGGALAVGGASSADSLVIGQQSGSTGTVINLEQITTLGTVVVGGAGTGTLELLGVASTMSDGGGDIGQSAGARGSVIVNGGEWTNNGLLTVGDAGTGSLLINGMNRGITGQVTAWNAKIGAQAASQGSVTLDGGAMLVADVSQHSSTLIVGEFGDGGLVLKTAARSPSAPRPGPARATTTSSLSASPRAAARSTSAPSSSLLVYGAAEVGGGEGGTGAADRRLGRHRQHRVVLAHRHARCQRQRPGRAGRRPGHGPRRHDRRRQRRPDRRRRHAVGPRRRQRHRDVHDHRQ